MNPVDLEHARMISTNSGDIRDMMDNMIDEIDSLRIQLEACGTLEATTPYHDLAMRTAAGPEVFHYPTGGDPQSVYDNWFIIDAIEYLVAAAKMDDWKSRLFYGKGKYRRNGLDAEAVLMPDYGDVLAKLDLMAPSLEYIANPQLIHAILGIATEGAKLVEGLLSLLSGEKDYREAPPILANMARETGDVDWFQELLALALGKSVEETRRINIERLAKRYPDKFSEEAGLARADEEIVYDRDGPR